MTRACRCPRPRAHALLQIITVALGSPLGREVAPREIGAMFAGSFAAKGGLGPADAKIMVACGAGAGLAAVYNVPLGGARFTLEALLCTFAPAAVISAIATSGIATLVAWGGLGNLPQYTIPHFAISPSLVVLAVITGPVFGFAGYWYTQLATAVRKKAPRDWRMIALCLGMFIIIGLCSIPFPQLLGNGKGPLELGFDGNLDIKLALILLALKLCATTGSLWAALKVDCLPREWRLRTARDLLCKRLEFSFSSHTARRLRTHGAAAFLAASMQLPLTAIALIFEFTHLGQDFLIPLSFSVAGSVATLHTVTHLRGKSKQTGKDIDKHQQNAALGSP